MRGSRIRTPRAKRRGAAPVPALALLLAGALGAGCEFPTAAPRFQSRFLLPLEETRVSAAELLPAGVVATGSGFAITVGAVSTQRTLGQMCGQPCTQRQSLVTPKPAFTDVVTLSLPLPPEVAGGTITGGNLNVTLSHSFNFDPLRPAGATQTGSIGLVVRSSGVTLGSATIDQAFPRTAPATRSIPLAGPVAGPVQLVLTLVSPAGGNVVIDNASSFVVSLPGTVVTASEARVLVQNRGISAQPMTLDLTGVDGGIRDRVRGGALVLVLSNPFAVAGTLQLRLQAATSGADIVRPVQVAPAGTTQRLELTQEELRSLLGHRVTATVAGPVSGTAGPITVRPEQELVLVPRLDLILEIGS